MSHATDLPEPGPEAATRPAMPVLSALRILLAIRNDRHVVVTNQASARLWPQLSDHELDFNYNPSTMGGAVPFALGLALAQPTFEIIVVSGDGSLLMSLGSLVSVVDSHVTNLTIVLLDNGCYEVTGGQRTPGSTTTDFAGLARAAGFPNVSHFWKLDDWEQRGERLLRARGPRFVWLVVRPEPANDFSAAPIPIDSQLARLAAALKKAPAAASSHELGPSGYGGHAPQLRQT